MKFKLNTLTRLAITCLYKTKTPPVVFFTIEAITYSQLDCQFDTIKNGRKMGCLFLC